MQKFILVVLMLILAACAPRGKRTSTEVRPTQASQPVVFTIAPPSASIAATPTAISIVPTLPAAVNADTIPAAFFAMNTVNPDDYPKLTFGTLSHPEIGAWAWIEQKKGVYDFSLFDKDISNAAAHGLVDATKTVNLSITLGETPPWAASDPKSCKTTKGLTWCTSSPANVQDWADFVTAVMNHYNGVAEPTFVITNYGTK